MKEQDNSSIKIYPNVANYFSVKGSLERGKFKHDNFNDTELRTFFGATNETIYHLRNEKRLSYFSSIKKILKKYIDTTELNYNLLSIWVLGTYFHSKLETFPLLTLVARKQSGKTRTLKLLSALSYGSDGSTSTSITETHLFRHKEGSMFFDEMESLSSKDKSCLRETINAVYKRGNKIVRYKEVTGKEGKDYKEVKFFPYYPLGIANIYGFGDVLADRSIQVILQRSNKKQTKLIEDFSSNVEIRKLKDSLEEIDVEFPDGIFSKWNDYIENCLVDEENKELFEKIGKTELQGRPFELFFPLFLVGDRFGVLDTILDTSREYMELLEGEYVDNIDDLLNEFVMSKKYTGYVPISLILNEFRLSLEQPEDWINSKWLGRALKRLGFVKGKRVVNGRSQVNINPTNTIIPIIPTNTTNTTNINEKEVGLGEFVDRVGLGGDDRTLLNEDGSKIEVVKIDGKEFNETKK